MKKRTNIFLGEEDKQAIALIREYYNLDTDASAVRFVVRREAKDIRSKRKEQAHDKKL